MSIVDGNMIMPTRTTYLHSPSLPSPRPLLVIRIRPYKYQYELTKSTGSKTLRTVCVFPFSSEASPSSIFLSKLVVFSSEPDII